MNLFKKVFGSQSEKLLMNVQPQVDQVLNLEPEMEKLSDEELQNKTNEFKERLDKGETLDNLLPEAFATVREAAWRVLNMKHYPVQVQAAIVLHQGNIAEMKTGEGKTLMSTLPAYLNALTGKGVHIVTVNDYLAERDRQWMGKVYEFLGLSVGTIIAGMKPDEKKVAYNADITYGTNNEFGFDYLRDNMVIYKENMVQRGLNYAIVDEVDSILIDEARTPLIISGKGDTPTSLYQRADTFVKTLSSRVLDQEETKADPFDREFKEETIDYLIDEKAKTATLTDKGIAKAEKYFGLDNFADVENMELSHNIKQALKANSIMKKDIDYVIDQGQIVIVDEFTGRMMHGRRYSDGLHQAIEAKEGLQIKEESKTLATITFQNYFRMYDKLAGMTGTAMTEEEEFREIYGMNVVEIPTNKPVIREDDEDVIYSTLRGKFLSVIEDIKERHAKGQPVLVGTASIDASETLSQMLKKERIPHTVLNAKYHAQESEIVAQAGRLGAVTIATNMAGRGTDIVLGGNPEFMAKQELEKNGMEDELLEQVDSFQDTNDQEVIEARQEYQKVLEKYKEETDEEAEQVIDVGGLHIIGTERHESRRIDNQLRGRAGRQGDPGSSRFYISAEDDLMRLFGGERFSNIMEATDIEETEAIENPMLTRAIESAQKRVEGNNFQIRKNVLKYDDVMNKQREIIYGERKRVLEGENLKDHIASMIDGVVEENVAFYTQNPDNWDTEGLENFLKEHFTFDQEEFDQLKGIGDQEELIDKIKDLAHQKYAQKEGEFDEETFREVERIVLLQVVDNKWMDHIDAMDQLRKGIGLRAMGQQDPAVAYANEGFQMFEAMNDAIREDTVKAMYHVQNAEKMERKQVAQATSASGGSEASQPKSQKPIVKGKKIGRNDPCPCGSGKKYKKCCGR